MENNKRPENMARINSEMLANAFIEEQIAALRKQVGDKKVLLALSGGVDSSVVAALLIKAIGKNLVCVHVNHGLLRKGEPEQVVEVFKNRMNVVKVADQDDFPDTAVNGDADFYKVIAIGADDDRPDEGHFSDENGGNAALGAWVTANAPFGDMTYLFMNDGIAFIFDNSQYECAEQTSTTTDQYCFGWIDVNGQKGPNRVVQCDTGSYVPAAGDDASEDDATCVVSNPTDIYPVMFYDQSIVPATAAGRAVLYAK